MTPEQAFKLLCTILTSGGIAIRALDSRIRDPIAQLIVEAIVVRGPSNVSAVARYVKQAKGSSSRTTIRQRLVVLEKEGVLRVEAETGLWILTKSFVAQVFDFCVKWFGELDFTAANLKLAQQEADSGR